MQAYGALTLVQAALVAAQGDKGMAGGILNALLGACCCCDDENGARQACDLMRAYDAQVHILMPDLVVLSLAYVATSANDEFQTHANAFLRRAEAMYNDNEKNIALAENSLNNKQPDWAALKRHHDIQLLQDEEEFVVLSKPSGMACYHTDLSSQANHTKRRKPTKSLETCLLEHGVPLSTLNQQGRGFVHRIDKGTSGCLVLAKTNRMHATLIARFFLRQVQKSYQALVVIPKEGASSLSLPKDGEVSLPINGRPAKSEYRVQVTFGPLVNRIQLKTEQGRKHQVRIHCAQGLQAPILLDPLYGGMAVVSRLANAQAKLSTQDNRLVKELTSQLCTHRSSQKICLHADTLVIPSVGIRTHAPLPTWWQSLEAQLLLAQRLM